jgi:uncharacterized protein YkwD
MMSDPFEFEEPFQAGCDVCGQRFCLHNEMQKGRKRSYGRGVLITAVLVSFLVGVFIGLRPMTPGNDIRIVPRLGSSSTAPIGETTGTVSLTAEEQEMLDLVNEERTRESLAPVTWCPALARSATDHSQDMALKNYFEHESLDGREVADRAKSQGYDFQTVGENIAVGQRDVAEVMQGWMKSPGHRENILRPQFTHLGSGVATGDFKGQESIYWTQNFGAGGNCQ